MQRFDVVGLGYSNVDYLGIVASYPALDEKEQLLEFSRQGGGVTATAMAAVGRLGGRASYIGKVGDDEFGRFTISELEKDGVHTDGVVVGAGPSQFSFVVVDKETGKRTIFWTPCGVRLAPHEIRREDVLAGEVLHVDAHHAEAALLGAAWANEAGIPVVMDAGSLREGTEELMARVDYLIASAKFAKEYTGESDPEEAARRMFTGRRTMSAVTLNEKGCVYVMAEGVFRQPAFQVDVVDTTGAGDVFHGAFSYGLSQGWPHAESVRFASAVAAKKCTKLGGRAGIPTMPEVREFLKDR
ncbi:MAG: PfkB family carbohydrate kinase [Armatimonadota bacterium]